MNQMEISKTRFAICIALTALLCVGFGYAINGGGFKVHRDPRARANVYILFETARGTWSGKGGNVITNIGERYVRNIMGWDNVTANNATQWISLSNDASPAASWTKLTNEVTANGFSRAANDTCVAWMNGTDYAFNVTKQFTASGTQTLQCAGLNWNPTADSDGNLFACAAFTQTEFSSGDNCTITWVITWDAN